MKERKKINRNKSVFGTAEFSDGELVEKKTKQEVIIDANIYDVSVKPKDVIYGEDVKDLALKIYNEGYASAHTTHVPEIDAHWKWKEGEITLLSGIGNYGKSTFLKYLIMLQVMYEGKKFAIFSPEDNPAEEYYHDLVEILLGCDCTPRNQYRPKRDIYERAYDFITNHFFYVYPKNTEPTPTYIKEVFLELIIKEKIEKSTILDIKLAAWLHDIGYIWEPKRHEERGVEYATAILNEMNFPKSKINLIAGMILATKIPQSPKNLYEQIVCDADLDYLGREGYEENSILLLQELRLKKEVTELDWLKIQDQFLTKHTYFTKTSNATRNKLKAEVMAKIKSTLKK